MKLWLPLSSLFLLFAIAVISLACGSSSTTLRGAQSLSLNPANADASQYPIGQVPFEAIAYYTSPPSPVKGVSATWGACYQGNMTSDVTVSAKGVAQCTSGASGTYTVWAFVMDETKGCPAFVNACGGGGCQVTGTAQLTCP